MIRKFEAKDTGHVMQIWLESNIGTHSFIPKNYWVSQYPSVQKQLLQADIFVYEQDSVIRGFVGIQKDYLAGIFVDENYRSMGIGKALLDYVKKIYPVFTLDVYRKNQRAVDFYIREGLSVVSEGVDENTAEAEYTMRWNRLSDMR